jgi:hypothetical protein
LGVLVKACTTRGLDKKVHHQTHIPCGGMDVCRTKIYLNTINLNNINIRASPADAVF